MDIISWIQTRSAFVFPGQGSQYVGMGKQLYDTSPAARRIFESADRVLGFALSHLCFEGPKDILDDTVNAQPAILTVSIACLEGLKERLTILNQTFAPVVVAGHSMGEFSALVAAGVMDFEDALRLVRERGRLMKESALQRPGGMAAIVGLDAETLERVCAEARSEGVVTIANDNSPGQAVLSGELAALEKAMALAKARGAKLVQRLAVSIASHSPLMQQAAQNFNEMLSQIQLRAPQVPLLSNITAQAMTTVEELREELSEQLTRPVQWTRSVQNAVSDGVSTFIELGPRQVLSGLIKRISREAKSISLNDVEIAQLLSEGGEAAGGR